jgi:hypothetical protein
MIKWRFLANKMSSQPGSRASQSIRYPSSSSSFSSSTTTSSSCHRRGWRGFREVEDAAAVVVAAVGVEEATAVVVLGAGAVVVVKEDVGQWLSRCLFTCLLTCLGNRHPSPRLSRHLRDRRDSYQGLSSPGSRSRATPWTSCGSHSSSCDSLQVMNLPK